MEYTTKIDFTLIKPKNNKEIEIINYLTNKISHELLHASSYKTVDFNNLKEIVFKIINNDPNKDLWPLDNTDTSLYKFCELELFIDNLLKKRKCDPSLPEYLNYALLNHIRVCLQIAQYNTVVSSELKIKLNDPYYVALLNNPELTLYTQSNEI